MKEWQRFEGLVAQIHSVLNAADYDVETDVTLREHHGATHQIDVLLRPKTTFAGPILISCKAWNSSVGVDHVREWADIVHQTGAASGIIVSKSGFTRDAVDAARNPVRRVSLWTTRPLILDDFGPDEASPDGYIARVRTKVVITEPHFVEGSLVLNTFRADGRAEGREIAYSFSAQDRLLWYLRDQQDAIVENLWDLFVQRATSAEQSGLIEIIPKEPRFVVLEGIRLGVRRVAFHIELRREERIIDVDLLKRAVAYQNVLTAAVSIVPLPQVDVLQYASRAPVHDGPGV
jgi:hypothetical protein